jgi:chromosome partitioning protein
MAKVIALFNQSGGVGKTTLCQNIGYQLAAKHERRVLLVDMDPQASLTIFMGLELGSSSKTIYKSLLSEETVALPVYQDIHRMSLSPTAIDLSEAEQQLILVPQRELRLQQSLAPLLKDYDYVLIDCPPSLGILSQNSLVAADYVLVPIQTQFKALMGADALLRTVKMVQKRLNPKLKFAGFCPTMYSASNELDQRTLESIIENLGKIKTVFPPIPRATAIAEAAESGIPYALSRKKQASVLEVFDKIALELEGLE